MATLKIVLLCILSAIVYGILHDQVTARVCVEYFTVGHAPIFHTESPTLLAFCWGTFATWWVGLILGVLAVLVSRVGTWPKIDAAGLIRPIACLLVVMAVASLVAGITGYQLAKSNHLILSEPYGSLIPQDHHWGFFADSLAHLAAYIVGALGGFILCVQAVIQRRRMALISREENMHKENACPTRPVEHGFVVLCRWIARAISVPLLGLIVVLVWGDGIPNPLTASIRENLLTVTVLLLLSGLVLGVKREGLGSVLILAGLALFAIVDQGLLLNILLTPWLATGVLYLVCWWMPAHS